MHSYDETPRDTELTYTWDPPDGIELSDVNAMNPTFTVPADLCSNGTSLNKISCCEDQDYIWTGNQECVDENEEVVSNWTQEKELIFSLVVFLG